MEIEPDHDTDAMDEEPENDTGDNIPVMIPIGTDVTQTGSPQSGQQNGNRKRVMSQDEEKQRRKKAEKDKKLKVWVHPLLHSVTSGS